MFKTLRDKIQYRGSAGQEKRPLEAQVAVEYLIILGVVTAICLLALRTAVPHSREVALAQFNQTVIELLGDQAAYNPFTTSYKARTLKTNYP